MNPFIGQIIMFAGNFNPRGWAFCQGQLLPIAQNTALFSILGTTYGGDGRTTFGLPDLRGRAAIHAGTGPGVSSYRLGEKGGVELQTQVPAHTHSFALQAHEGGADQTDPASHRLAEGANIYSDQTTGLAPMASETTASSGTAGGVNNLQPFLVLNFIIALEGTYPSRS